METTIERQELHCHNCDQYVQFDIDMSLNGNHVLTCPNCGHEHCRVVKDGIITEDRWDSRNPTYAVGSNNITYSTTSTYNTMYGNGFCTNSSNLYASYNTLAANYNTNVGTSFLYQSWMNTVTV